MELIRTVSQKVKQFVSAARPRKKALTAYGIDLTKDAVGKIPAGLDGQFRLQYHQNSDSLNARNELWQLPDTSKHVQPQQLLGPFEHPIEKRYFKDLELICRYWNCSEQDILPLGLRKTTPYSQAMLALLRRIACASRGDTLPCREQAHDALLRTVKARLQREGCRTSEMVILVTPPPKLEHTTKQGLRTRTLEETVFVRRDGLTFEDAEAVRAMLMVNKRAVKKARRMATNVSLRHQRCTTKNVTKTREESDVPDSDSVVSEDVQTARMASGPERKQKARWNVWRPSNAPSDGGAAEREAKIKEVLDILDNQGLQFKDVEAAWVERGLEKKLESKQNVWGQTHAPVGSNVEDMVSRSEEELSDSSDDDGGVELEVFNKEFLR